jgi:hypothetical protein
VSVVRTLSVRPVHCLVATAALAVAAAGTSVIVAGSALPATAGTALPPLPPVTAGATLELPATQPVQVSATVDADPLVRGAVRTAGGAVGSAVGSAGPLAAGVVQQALSTADRTVAVAVPLVVDTAEQAAARAIELAGTPVSGTVTLCPGAVVTTGAQVRTGDLLVVRGVGPIATLAAAGGAVSDVKDGVRLDRQGASITTPRLRPTELGAAAGSDAATLAGQVPVRAGVGSSWQTLPTDGSSTAVVGAGPLSLGTTGSTCSPFDWAILR